MSAIEVMLLRWGESNSAGRTVTFQLPESDTPHPFKHLRSGAKDGQRMAIAVTLINDDESEKPHTHNMSANCAMLCEDETFQDFILTIGGVHTTLGTTADFVRGYLGVKSRAELDTSPDALLKWEQLKERFVEWGN